MSKFKTSVLLLIFMFCIFRSESQNDQKKAIYNLAAISKNWFEGFQKSVGTNEFSYHSFRTDVGKSLITRCTDGKMAIKWQTQVVPTNFDKEEAGFLWIAALDLTPQPFVFDVFVNGQKRFGITSSNQKEWQLKTAGGGTLSFVTVETDQAAQKLGMGYAFIFLAVVTFIGFLYLKKHIIETKGKTLEQIEKEVLC